MLWPSIHIHLNFVQYGIKSYPIVLLKIKQIINTHFQMSLNLIIYGYFKIDLILIQM